MSVIEIATPGLTFREDGHVYLLDGVPVPSVTQVLDFAGLRGRYDHVPAGDLERARQRGTALHAAAHYLDEGDLDESTVDPVIRPYLGAWQAFKADRRIEFVSLEQRVADPILRFAGTIDRIAKVPGHRKLIVVDIKTGLTTGANYQTAGYVILAAHLKPLVRSRFLLERWAVSMHPERRVPYSVHPYRDEYDFEVFEGALRRAHASGHWRKAS